VIPKHNLTLLLAIALSACFEPPAPSWPYDHSCSADQDCEIVATDPKCDSCCKFDALNKSDVDKYNKERENAPCLNLKPYTRECDCFNVTPICTDGKCKVKSSP